MSTAKCELDLGGQSGPKGVEFYATTAIGGTQDCTVQNSSSELFLEIKNHNKHAIGVKIECESEDGDVEFDTKTGYQNEWTDSAFLKSRSTSPVKENLHVGLRPSTRVRTSDEISVKVNIQRVVISAAPDIDEGIEVDVN